MFGSPHDGRTLDRLFALIETRKRADPDSSYTARLFGKGRRRIAKKVGEEAVEVVIAALAEGPQQLAAESADLLYHLLVLWAASGVTPEEVWEALGEREHRSGLAEKASRRSVED
jgi:phosphoribosyl-ATP pyrophosphohydrolase